jgi:hypothetical protein
MRLPLKATVTSQYKRRVGDKKMYDKNWQKGIMAKIKEDTKKSKSLLPEYEAIMYSVLRDQVM